MLLRLRQICVHPALIQETCDTLIASDEIEAGHDWIVEQTRAAQLVSTDFVLKMRVKYKEAAMARVRAEKEVGATHHDRGLVFIIPYSLPMPLLKARSAPCAWMRSQMLS